MWVSVSIVFLWKFIQRQENEPLFHGIMNVFYLKSSEWHSWNSKYLNIIRYFENQRYWFWTQEIIWHPNVPQTFWLLDAKTNKNSVKLIRIDMMPGDLHTFSVHTRFNNSDVSITLYLVLYTFGILTRHFAAEPRSTEKL